MHINSGGHVRCQLCLVSTLNASAPGIAVEKLADANLRQSQVTYKANKDKGVPSEPTIALGHSVFNERPPL